MQTKHAYHCTACNKCIIDFEEHSLLVNTCITASNRQYLIMFLMCLLSFLLTLVLISVLHFDKPQTAIENAISEHFDLEIEDED